MNPIRPMIARCLAAFLSLPALLALFMAPALAQTGTTLLSHPAGSELRLSGDVRINGFSPMVIDEGITGDYLLTALRPGYARESVRLRFARAGGTPRVIGGGPFSSFLGAVHALFLPGVGQYGQGHALQGLSLFGLEATGVAFALKQDAGLRAASTDYDRANDYVIRTQGTLTDEQQVDANDLRLHARNRLEDARSARKQWLMFAGAAWAYSFVDQAFLSRRLNVRQGSVDTLVVRLSPISRGETLLRSLFLPGSGQIYAGHVARGGLLLAVTGGFAAGALFGTQHYARTVSEYGEAQTSYDDLKSRGITDLALRGPASDRLAKRFGQAQQARRLRSILWAAAVGSWALNVLDAMVIEIPGQGGQLADRGMAPGMFATMTPGSVALGYRRGF